jgi:hypothetical protein
LYTSNTSKAQADAAAEAAATPDEPRLTSPSL